MFDGASLAFDAAGKVIARGAEHDVDLVMVDVAAGRGAHRASDQRPASRWPRWRWERATTRAAAASARRCSGLSGRIDSALVACIAARALGPKQVLGVAMPSRYSSPGSLADAEALALLGIDFCVVPIEPMFAAYLDTLAAPLESFVPRVRPPPRRRPPIAQRRA